MTAYVVAFGVTLATSLVLVMTQRWHGSVSTDSTLGLQKFHTCPTPRIGGVAIVLGLAAASLASSQQVRAILVPLLLAGIPAFLAGLIEDLSKRLGVKPRLLATMCSGVLAWYLTGVAMQDTGIYGVDFLLSFTPVAVLFTAFAVGGVANAVNIIDGFNGLAAGVVAIMLAAMGIISVSAGDAPLAAASFVLATCALGFGAVNWPFGKIFLGDGGAYFLGFAVAWVAVLLPMRNSSVNAWATLVACAYPVLEVVFSYRRKSQREGSDPSQPDRVHFHMLLHRRLARPLFRHSTRAVQNGMTSPFAWMYAAVPATWAVVFAQDTAMLMVGFAGAAALYAVLYRRLTRFTWALSLVPARAAAKTGSVDPHRRMHSVERVNADR
jgi:UDP-N-acetylmuramyl pentapeptide phosphotransferase/UDP-N-acetylglucosamine-1-phosphate transferase